MIDRLKFRAHIKDYVFYDNDGNDIEKSFYLYDIAVYSNTNGFGIDTDLLEKQLSEQGFSEREIESVLQDVDNNEGWCYFDCYCDIEQCTGLKDKKGNLIYDGDIVKGEHTYNLIIKIDNVGLKYEILQGKDAEFIEQYLAVDLVNGEDGFVYEQHFEIIGNIHENKELLK